jgi:hypothetical protein
MDMIKFNAAWNGKVCHRYSRGLKRHHANGFVTGAVPQ